VWIPVALALGIVTALGISLRRRKVGASGIDVGAVSDQWVAENRPARYDPFN
jgi:hypothetical protein